MFRLNENIIDEMMTARNNRRNEEAAELARQSDAIIKMAADRLNLEHVVGESRFDLIERIVNAKYPDLADEAPEVSRKSGLHMTPIRESDGSMFYPEFAPTQRYADMANGQQSLAVDETDGVSVLKVNDERVLVGFQNADQSVTRLDVSKVIQVSGLDLDPKERRTTVVVHIPSWWVEADYVKRHAFMIYKGILTDTETALDQLNALLNEQGWWDEAQAALSEPPFVDNRPHSPNPVFDEATQSVPTVSPSEIGPILSNEQELTIQDGDWREAR